MRVMRRKCRVGRDERALRDERQRLSCHQRQAAFGDEVRHEVRQRGHVADPRGPDGDICVDVCDDGVKAACSSANKEACSAFSTTCGVCKEGFVADVGDTCVLSPLLFFE